jgi:hydrogenase maturation protease
MAKTHPSSSSAKPAARVVLIGIGNEYRGDDAVGLVVARRLREKLGARATVLESDGEATRLMEAWEGADTVILIDAVSSGGEPGTLHRFDARVQPIPARFGSSSSHASGLAEAIELARALNRLPWRLIVYGIEGERFEVGVGLSSAVEKVVPKLVERLVQEVRAME